MSSQSSVFCECNACRTDIHYGDSIVEISLSVEQFDEVSGQLAINNLHEDLLLILCDRCGNELDNLEELRRHLSSSKDLPLHAVTSCGIGSDETAKADTCNGCGAAFGQSYIRYSIIRISGVIAWNSFLNMGDMTVTDSVEVCPFCQDCGSVIDSDHLQSFLLDFINMLQLERGL